MDLIMVKFGILSDTFITRNEDQGFIKILLGHLQEAFKSVDQIIHAGNIIDFFFLEALEKIAPVNSVQGEADNIRDLKKYLKIKGGAYNIGIIHRKPQELEDFFKRENLHILIYGNSCQPLIEGTPYNTLLINPGSPTRPKAPLPKRGFEKPIARPSVITLNIDEDNILSTYIINLKNK